MSKYTTEVRYICETLAGLTESVGEADVEQVIANCLPQLFNFNFPIFDEKYRTVLETKILRHYYNREIGLETFGLWRLKLNTKLNEIMPYYNKLYKADLLEFNPFHDTDLTREHKRTGDESRTEDRDRSESTKVEANNSDNVQDNGTTTVSDAGHGTSAYSDTPQGELQNVEQALYVSEYTVNNSTNNSTTTNNSTSDRNYTEDRNVDVDGSDSLSAKATTTEEYLEHVYGKAGGANYADILMKYRESFINIDMMVINDLEDLFMQLW